MAKKGRFFKGLKWGVILGATAAVLSDEKKRRDIAGKLKVLQAEVEKQTKVYRKNWPRYKKTARAEAKKLLEQASRVQKELGKKAKVYEKEGEKVRARVVTETQGLVREAGNLLGTFSDTAQESKKVVKRAAKTMPKAAKKKAKKKTRGKKRK